MMFQKTALVLIVSIIGISWTQASVMKFFIEKHGNISPPPGYDDGSIDQPKKGECPLSEDFDSVYDSSDPRLRNRFEAEISKIYDYINSPEDKYIKDLTNSSYTFAIDDAAPPTDVNKVILNTRLFQEMIEKPNITNKCALVIIEIALKQIKESADELEKTLKSYVIHGNVTALQQTSHLATEEKQHEIRVILLRIPSLKTLLQNLNRILNSFFEDSTTTTFISTVDGLSLEGLTRFTLSVMITIRKAWTDWKLILYNAHNVLQ